jgi:hypothetical protein
LLDCEAIATAIQEARRQANGSNDPIAVVVDELADGYSQAITACLSVSGSCVPASREQTSALASKKSAPNADFYLT